MYLTRVRIDNRDPLDAASAVLSKAVNKKREARGLIKSISATTGHEQCDHCIARYLAASSQDASFLSDISSSNNRILLKQNRSCVIYVTLAFCLLQSTYLKVLVARGKLKSSSRHHLRFDRIHVLPPTISDSLRLPFDQTPSLFIFYQAMEDLEISFASRYFVEHLHSSLCSIIYKTQANCFYVSYGKRSIKY